ncbi:hypothetical protein P7K49_027932, partial [Saguinus oedipus]
MLRIPNWSWVELPRIQEDTTISYTRGGQALSDIQHTVSGEGPDPGTQEMGLATATQRRQGRAGLAPNAPRTVAVRSRPQSPGASSALMGDDRMFIQPGYRAELHLPARDCPNFPEAKLRIQK